MQLRGEALDQLGARALLEQHTQLLPTGEIRILGDPGLDLRHELVRQSAISLISVLVHEVIEADLA